MPQLLSLYSLRFAALAGLLALGACHSDSPEPQVQPQQGAVMFVHGDHQVAASRVNFTIDGVPGGDYAYGQGSPYLFFDAGQHTLTLTAGSATAANPIRLEPNVAYSYFAAPTASGSGIGGRLFTDDVKPKAGQARIRLANLLTNAGPDVELALVPASAPGTYQHVAYDGEVFSEVAPVTTNLVVLSNTKQVLAQVGSGTGTNSGVRKYEDSHVYTVVVAGDPTASSADARPKAFVLTNL